MLPSRHEASSHFTDRDGQKIISKISMKTAKMILQAAVATIIMPSILGLVNGDEGSTGRPSFLSPHVNPVIYHDGLVYVANTPADSVDVIDPKTRMVVHRTKTGIEPMSLAIRPDGSELWVSNHVSDSVNVIDISQDSPTRFQILATVQELDQKSRSTQFDEPAGIAFANNDKAYVALSSENQIAVIDTHTYLVEKRLKIPAQDPRAIAVHNNRLYVIPFESNNQTQLSGGSEIDGDLVTFNAWEHSIRHNNVLSLGHVTDIVKHPRVPDRDLFIFDTGTDSLIEVVDGLGTLLYGLTVDAQGTVYIAQTDARNHINGRAGSQGHTLAELDNRAFLNRISKVTWNEVTSAKKEFLDLEPLPPAHPARDEALATPYAIALGADGSTIFATAAGSDVLFSMDSASGEILGRIGVGSVPRGLSIHQDQAWVLNAVGNSISLVDISNPSSMKITDEIQLFDPTPEDFKSGRAAFNSASASSTGTFSCASCHPDGHTDQLLWVLKTPIVTGGNQIMPRSTMPVRGLRETAPFHWDGIPGDPYGGINSANIYNRLEPNSDIHDPASQVRHLIDGGLASTMLHVDDSTENNEKLKGYLSGSERDDMAQFLLNIPYPPAQRRAYNNELSERARQGFELFHIIGDEKGTPGSNLCGNCHRMPFWVSSNTPGTGMDAPTWRGAYDRFLILPQGRLNIIDFDFYERIAQRGIPEREVWRFSWGGRQTFDPVWDMVLEGSTGHSGSFGRQWTLNAFSWSHPISKDIINSLETAAAQGVIRLEVDGHIKHEASVTDIENASEEYRKVALQFTSPNRYRENELISASHAPDNPQQHTYSLEELFSLAAADKFTGTWTARHYAKEMDMNAQPAIWTRGPIHSQRGKQQFPVLGKSNRIMSVSGRHIPSHSRIFVNGQLTSGTIQFEGGDNLEITLENLPQPGIHFLQIQSPSGLFSNDFIFHVAGAREIFASLQNELHRAVEAGNLKRTKSLIEAGASPNGLPDDGGSPLSTAAMKNHFHIAVYLLNVGGDLDIANKDGNTPLHISAFFCRKDITNLFLNHGASIAQRNNRGETPIDVVKGPWSPELRGFYSMLSNQLDLNLNISQIPNDRNIMLSELSHSTNHQ